MLSKSQIAAELEAQGLGRKRQIMNIIDGIADLAVEEVANGEGFSIPGLVKIDWTYTKPRAKGEMYRKGETYVGFGGEEQVAEADSKERKAKVTLKASPGAALKRLAPKGNDRAGQSKFLRSKAGKAVVSRKG